MRDVAFIALGSNVGDRAAFLALARQRLAALPRSCLRAVSTIEETEPIGPIGETGPVPQGPYLNQMAALETDLDPLELLDALLDIERLAGRTRAVRWGPRTLDLDIVLFERQRLATSRLVVPHPELAHRDFWRRGLGELRSGGGGAADEADAPGPP